MEVNILNTILGQVNSLKSISLEEINKVTLLNRTDTKYAFNIQDLEGFLKYCENEYYVLEIEGKRLMKYNSLYFDYENFDLYRLHQNGKLNRYKVRVREYVETNVKFLETKFKTNKGRTIKIRQPKENGFELSSSDIDFIKEKTDINAPLLKPVLWVFYYRVTLVNYAMTERVTLDLDLLFDNKNKQVGFPKIAIAEVKRDKTASESTFVKLLREAKIESSGLSKYCLGMASTYEGIKYNNMKPKILELNKISNKYVN